MDPPTSDLSRGASLNTVELQQLTTSENTAACRNPSVAEKPEAAERAELSFRSNSDAAGRVSGGYLDGIGEGYHRQGTEEERPGGNQARTPEVGGINAGYAQIGQRRCGRTETKRGWVPSGGGAAWAAGGLGIAVVAGLVVAMTFGARRRREGGNRGGDGSGNPFELMLSWVVLWWVVSALAILLSALIGGAIWLVVRLARWREEVMAFSPIIDEAMARAAAVDEAVGLPQEASMPRLDAETKTTKGDELEYIGNVEMVDPVGRIFGPGTQASHAFYPAAEEVGSLGRGTHRRNKSCSAGATGQRNYGSVEGEVVFLTGVTGLVGQMVLHDLLRLGTGASESSVEAGAEVKVKGKRFGGGQEGVGTGTGRVVMGRGENTGEGGTRRRRLRQVLVMIRRGKKGVSAADRLQALKDSPMFRALRENGAWVDGDGEDRASPAAGNVVQGGAVVSVVEGDLAEEGLGLTAESRSLLVRAGVTRALHCAASVRFSDPLAEAAGTNITGALRVAALVASWPTCR